MRDHLNTKDFNDAVKNLPFIGYRTRMDLAFKVTHEQLLTKAGGNSLLARWVRDAVPTLKQRHFNVRTFNQR